jgi:septal ring-binding cell division protein DamX
MTGTQSPPGVPTRDLDDTLCAQCGAELAEDQEWCLECGGARTMIHRAPDWRVAVAVIVSVVLLVIGGFVAVLASLSSGTETTVTVTSSVTVTHSAAVTRAPGASSATTATNAAGTSTANLAAWPSGLPGWTVVLASSHNRATADADARRIAAEGIQVGVLDSSDHPQLAPGYWVVFAGRYPTQQQALAAATKLAGLGQTSAHPRLVGRPGA